MNPAAPPTTRQERLDILGVPVDTLPDAEVERWLDATLSEPWDGRCHHVVTLNPEYVMAARVDPAFAAAIHAADLVVADGVGIVVAARLIHGIHLTRQTGVALTERLVAKSQERAAPVFLLGAGPGVARAAAAALTARLPGAAVADLWDGGSPDGRDDAEALARIRACGARVVLVAYGAAGQVDWIVRNQAALAESGVRLAVGVGGAFDFLSGRVARAPHLIRRIGLEWLYRLVREPWRWRRQLALPRFAALTLLAALRQRLPRP